MCTTFFFFLMFKCHVAKDLSVGEIDSQISNFFCGLLDSLPIQVIRLRLSKSILFPSYHCPKQESPHYLYGEF